MLFQPSLCDETLARAKQAFDSRSFAVAATEFEDAVRICPAKAPILISLGQTQYLLGDEQGAERSLRQAIALNPKDTAGRYALGRIYYQQNRFPEAVAQLKQVVELDPKHYRGWDNLGLCYDALQQDQDALRSFFRALDLVKDEHREYDWAYGNLADFFLKRNEFEKAFQLAAEAASRNPQSARNFFLTGKALTKLERNETSLRWLRRAVELDAGYADAHYLLGRTLRKLGQEEEARAHLETFRKLKATAASRSGSSAQR